jgi:hypothetical protein
MRPTRAAVSLGAVAVAAVLAGAPAARAQDADVGEGAATSRIGVYSDDDDTTVVTTTIDTQVQLPATVSLGAHVLMDAVSSASVDVVSAATPRWTEERIETGARAGAQVGSTGVGLSYVRSAEPDWLSHSLQTTLTRDLARKNTRVQLGYGYTINDVGRAHDPAFIESMSVHTVEAGVLQLANRRTAVGATYTLQLAQGFQSSPYRYVVTTGGLPRLETHPDARSRHAVSLRVLRALGPTLGWDSSYRFYADDWSVRSHTLTSALRIELSDAWEGRVRARAYYQTGAAFYREQYAAPALYMSTDRELATFWDVGGGVKLGWHSARWEVDVALDGTYYRFLDFATLAGRVALVLSAGARLTW